MRGAAAVFTKDLYSELRTRYALNALIMFVVVTLSIILFSTAGETVSPSLSAGILWIIIFFSAMSGLSRSFVSEEERGTTMTLRAVGQTYLRSSRQTRFQCGLDLHFERVDYPCLPLDYAVIHSSGTMDLPAYNCARKFRTCFGFHFHRRDNIEGKFERNVISCSLVSNIASTINERYRCDETFC